MTTRLTTRPTTGTRSDIRMDRTVIGLLILGIALGTWSINDLLPPWLWIIAVIMAAWRWQLVGSGRPPPPSNVRTLIGISFAGFLYLTGNIGLGLEAAIPLFISFMWLKLLEVHHNRDIGMMAALGSFLAGAGVLLNQSLAQVGLVMVSIICLWSAALAAHLGSNGARWKHALRQVTVMLAQAAPIALALFVLLPRPAIRINLSQGQARSGISDHLSPGGIANLALDKSVAFRVEFPRGNPIPISQLYWRGIVLSVTDGRSWYRDDRTNGSGHPPRLIGDGEDPAVFQQITLLPHGHTWLYAIDPPVTPSDDVAIGPGSELVRTQAVSTPLQYQVTSYPKREPADGDNITLARASQIPDNLDPRLINLANQWRSEWLQTNGELDALLNIATKWFRDQGFAYSLQPGVMEGDPVATFLFERKAGFCSHYATAFALLARLENIPSRVVMGYRGGEMNDIGDFLIVRNAHAHAWCECYDHRTGTWRRYDPTAMLTEDQQQEIAENGGAAGDSQHQPSAFDRNTKSMRQWYDYVDARWQGFMYRFDASMQLDLRERLGIAHYGRFGMLIGSIIICIFLLGILALLLRSRRVGRDPLLKAYHQWRVSFATAGCLTTDQEAPLAFAQRASLAAPERQAEIAAVTDAYCQARYAANPQVGLHHLRNTIRGATGQPLIKR